MPGPGLSRSRASASGPTSGNVLQPHSVPLQQLADGGVVALGLFVLVILAGIAVCVCAIRRLSGAERAAAVALVAAPAAYLVHALVDFNWDFIAVTAPTMVALGVLAAAGRAARAAGEHHPLLAVGVGAPGRRRARLVLVPAARRSRGAALDPRAGRR